MPLHYKVNGWIWKLVKSNGGNVNIGQDIWNIFSSESISIENIKTEAITQTPLNNISLVPIVQMLSRLLIIKKIASEQELNDINLFEKLESEKKKLIVFL